MKKISCLFAVAVFLIVGCGKKSEDIAVAELTVSADSLMNSFIETWNSADAGAIVNGLADDVVLVDEKGEIVGKEDVAKKFVEVQIKTTKNLSGKNSQASSSSELAFCSGTWSLQAAGTNDTVLQTGTHSFGWKKQSDGSWKINLIHIHNTAKKEKKV